MYYAKVKTRYCYVKKNNISWIHIVISVCIQTNKIQLNTIYLATMQSVFSRTLAYMLIFKKAFILFLFRKHFPEHSMCHVSPTVARWLWLSTLSRAFTDADLDLPSLVFSIVLSYITMPENSTMREQRNSHENWNRLGNTRAVMADRSKLLAAAT